MACQLLCYCLFVGRTQNLARDLASNKENKVLGSKVMSSIYRIIRIKPFEIKEILGFWGFGVYGRTQVLLV